jgi:hypothetical protein
MEMNVTTANFRGETRQIIEFTSASKMTLEQLQKADPNSCFVFEVTAPATGIKPFGFYWHSDRTSDAWDDVAATFWNTGFASTVSPGETYYMVVKWSDFVGSRNIKNTEWSPQYTYQIEIMNYRNGASAYSDEFGYVQLGPVGNFKVYFTTKPVWSQTLSSVQAAPGGSWGGDVGQKFTKTLNIATDVLGN